MRRQNVDEEIAKTIAAAVWNRLDCVKIGRMGRSIEDVNFIVDIFLRNGNNRRRQHY
ncbi:MAG: hypothetical protein WCF06_14285 [Nitrososphaeraceae archaeon]